MLGLIWIYDSERGMDLSSSPTLPEAAAQLRPEVFRSEGARSLWLLVFRDAPPEPAWLSIVQNLAASAKVVEERLLAPAMDVRFVGG